MDDLFSLFTGPLERAGVGYMVTGSVAAMVYGEPRLTHGVDVVVALDGDKVDALVAAFAPTEFYCAPTEVIRVELARRQRGHFNIIHHESGFKADVYIAGRDPLHAWAMSRRRVVRYAGADLQVAPAEYVIVRKLEYYREGGSEKHIEDVQGILRHSSDDIDMDELERLVVERGLQAQWQRARALR